MFANQESEGDVFRNMILPVRACEIRCDALAEEYRLRMLKNRVRRHFSSICGKIASFECLSSMELNFFLLS